MAKYIDRDAAIAACFDGFADCRDDCAANIRNIPAADVVERKPMAEDVEKLIGMMRDYAKECASGDDMCASCQFSYFCEGGWTPDAISDKLVELANKATERKTGKWRRYSPLTDTFECDQCGYQVIDKEFRTNFCPNCGADMRPEPPKEET